ncbi:MAG: hypothetical protein HY664_08485 [Chloroflexi bacterium]|nr:hypothetical protein [Chloroflexota bacterium]
MASGIDNHHCGLARMGYWGEELGTRVMEVIERKQKVKEVIVFVLYL